MRAFPSRPSTIIAIVFYIIVLLYSNLSVGKHFRGGTLSLKPVFDSNNSEVQMIYRISYTRSHSGKYFCEIENIGQPMDVEGKLEILEGCPATRSSVPYRCLDFSEAKDWTSGGSNITIQCNASFIMARHYGIGWLPVLNGKDAWSLLVNASLEYRSDVRRQNTPPTTAMQPLVSLLYGCEHTISIPAVDADGDVIRCRWATDSQLNECGEVCSRMPGLTLNREKCYLHLAAEKEEYPEPGLYVVAVQIEDFYHKTSQVPFSSIPLQFLIEVFKFNVSCKETPVITESRHSGEKEIGIPTGSTFKEQLIATSPSDSQEIVAIDTVSPPGMTKGPLLPYILDPSGRSKYVEMTWVPAEEQAGKHLLCYSAVTNVELTSGQLCVELAVGEEHIHATGPPTVTVKEDSSALSIADIIGIVLGVIGLPSSLLFIYKIIKYCRHKYNRDDTGDSRRNDTSDTGHSSVYMNSQTFTNMEGLSTGSFR